MNPVAVITLSKLGAEQGARLVAQLDGSELFIHEGVLTERAGRRFDTVRNLTRRIFGKYKGFVYIMPCGVVIRSMAGLIKGKLVDPAVVVVDVGARYAISLLSGHEGGANELALQVGNILSAEPVITTTTEAEKDLILGIGCRRGISEEAVLRAVRAALKKIQADVGRVRLLATVDIKKDEEGLTKAAATLGIGLRIISSGEILSTGRNFEHSAMVARNVRVPAVAEPVALLAGRRTRLILRKIKMQGVTVAVAQENSL